MTIRTDVLTVVQKALYTRLDAALVESVYNSPPSAEAYPYVVIGDDEILEESTADGRVIETIISVDVYSDADSNVEVKTITGAIQNDLTNTVIDLSADNFKALRMMHENTGFSIEIDRANRRIHHATLNFRFMVQDIT